MEDVGASEPKDVVHGFLFGSKVVLNNFGVALLAESIAVSTPME